LINFSLKGQHQIDITFANLPIKGSPFFTEVYDPSQVRIGPLPTDMTVGIEITFQINFDNAGNIPLEMKISSPTDVNGKLTKTKVQQYLERQYEKYYLSLI
jgi:hypothetical protein